VDPWVIHVGQSFQTQKFGFVDGVDTRIRLIGHRKDIEMLTFRALALRRSEGLFLETRAFESLYGGQYSLFQLSSLTQIFIHCFISETKTNIPSLSLYQRRLIRWACPELLTREEWIS